MPRNARPRPRTARRALRARTVAAISIALILATIAVVVGVNSGVLTPDARLDRAVRALDLDSARAALEDGADVHRRDLVGGSYLHTAAYWGEEDLALLLLAHGLPVDATDHQGQTPLHAATRGERLDMVRLLLDAGASPSLRTGADLLGCDGTTIRAGATAQDIAEQMGARRIAEVLGLSAR